jgi:cysteine desulfurase
MSITLQTDKKKTNTGPVYLDCNATTPLEPSVQKLVLQFMAEEYGNSGSRTHEFGNRAKVAVQRARDQVASLVKCQREEVIFTSGATESNNLALLGLRDYGEKVNRKHIVSTAIEHKAVLEPLEYLQKVGFEVTIVRPEKDGVVTPDALAAAIRPDTLLVSVMHVNNETGIIQPIREIAALLESHEAYFHVDAAQGFGKRPEDLENPRIELMSISGHKIFGPKGIGALIVRRRGYERPPLTPLLYGGGQERGLRPGTLPVPLIVGLGEASALAHADFRTREKRCRDIRGRALDAFSAIGGIPTGDQSRVLPSTLNMFFPGLDSEAVMLALKHEIAISNGSACTSQSYTPSHVLKAMDLPTSHISGALRFSWCHLTPDLDWQSIAASIASLH